MISLIASKSGEAEEEVVLVETIERNDELNRENELKPSRMP